jgi:hypothetical protein
VSKISRAGDILWSVSAFDPKKPFDPDWASSAPKPVLRSGDENRVFRDGPDDGWYSDEMRSSPETTGGMDDLHFDEPEEPEEFSPGARPDVPAHDLEAIGRHIRRLRGGGGSTPLGELVGNDPRGPMAQYHNNSNVAHYYTYNPHERHEGKPWVLSTTHWELPESLSSRHETFEQAALGAKRHKDYLKHTLGID